MKGYEFQLHPPHDLLPDAKLIDFAELVWNLEKTVEANIDKWGWVDKTCSVCGSTGVVVWDRKYGYRCEKDREHAGYIVDQHDFKPGSPRCARCGETYAHVVVYWKGCTAPELGGYAGEVDGSGSYEHDWPVT